MWAIVEISYMQLNWKQEVQDCNVIGPFETKADAMKFYFGDPLSSIRALCEAEDHITINGMDVSVVEMQVPVNARE